MNSKKTWTKYVVIYAVTGVVISTIMYLFFRYNEFFQSLFFDRITPPGGEVAELSAEQAAESVRAATQAAGNLSFGVMLFVLLLQVFAFMTAYFVFKNLKRSEDDINLKLKKLENADLFLDLPLYFGLFGTVSSFIIMNFNPQVSRLLAYSSTLVGIIFSVILRLALQYPIRQKFIAELTKSDK